MDASSFIFVFWPLMALVGYYIGQSRGRAWGGAALGLALGPLGWLLVAVGPNLKNKCPHCLGPVPDGATRCLHCAGELYSPSVPAAPAIAADDRMEVHCPACAASNFADATEYHRGLKCSSCGVGWVPAA